MNNVLLRKENAYHRTFDTLDSFDDESLTRTKSYTRAVFILRQFHDMLNLTLDTFEDFIDGELGYFETNIETLDKFWSRYLESISDDLASLRYWQRMLSQKIQTFDRMKDGVTYPQREV